VLPDAPDDSPPAPAGAGVGQLTAASIREVWPEIITTVGRQSKKLAALASGATVRDLDGENLVLTFRFPAHAKMVASDPDLITNALYEALGGRWEIRCEVAGEAGAVQVAPGGRTPRSAPAQKNAPAARSAPASSVKKAATSAAETATATAASARPREPARQRQPEAPSPSGGDDDWPEPARPGGSAAASADAGGPDVVDGPASPSGGVAPDGAPASLGRNVGPPADDAPIAASANARAAPSARNGATGAQAPASPVATPVDPVADDWPDGAAAEEPPYDPDYDGPVRAAPVAYEGFDPGDEPLDDVLNENTARQSSEQQAMQLLQDAFGAEKIGES
jgi:DNA polymerase III subunit gamma/tau